MTGGVMRHDAGGRLPRRGEVGVRGVREGVKGDKGGVARGQVSVPQVLKGCTWACALFVMPAKPITLYNIAMRYVQLNKQLLLKPSEMLSGVLASFAKAQTQLVAELELGNLQQLHCRHTRGASEGACCFARW